MAMNKQKCVEAIVNYYDCTFAPLLEGLATPSNPISLGLLEGDKLQAEALFLLAGEDSCELETPGGRKLIIRKESLAPGKGWIVTIQFP